MKYWKIHVARYLRAREYAKVQHAKQQRAEDPGFSNVVHIRHVDGSVMLFVSAFTEVFEEDILIVYTEHHEYRVYPRDEVEVKQWRFVQLKELLPKLGNLNQEPPALLPDILPAPDVHWPRLSL